MSAQFDIFGLGATRIVVGLSQVVRVVPTANQYTESFKIAAGGGTLEIVGIQLSGSSTNTGTSLAWGTGYPVGASEVINVGGPAAFYLAATGATMTVAMYLGYTAGCTLL